MVKKKKNEGHFPVVGIGASAGGLKAIRDFFSHLPDDSSMAFIVIIHLAPDKSSSLDDLVQDCTSMKVMQVSGKTEIKPNHIYVIAPDRQLFIEDNHLLSSDLEDRKGRPATIDLFFRSLAKARAKKAICVILSGTGTDGTVGLKSVKEYSGISMAQDPDEAQYDGMPCSAIDTGLVDFVLPAKELAHKVVDQKKILSDVQLPLEEKELSEEESKALQDIFEMLRKTVGRDFTDYKRSSVLRRIERRMHVTRNASLKDYAAYLVKNSDEVKELFKDLLISVTNFFRDPEAFEMLEKKIIPKLFERKKRGDQIRVWCTGCATGEEAYSLAILLHEHISELDDAPDIQLFATDIDEDALKVARKGWYAESITADVSDKRLQRFFIHEDYGYRVRDEIRETVLFAVHDLLSDTPFSKQDLIACRNVLIYFKKNLQQRVFNLLHYALRPKGYLFLGSSDSIHMASGLFKTVSGKKGIFQSQQASGTKTKLPHIPFTKNRDGDNEKAKPINQYAAEKKEMIGSNIEDKHHKLLIRQYAPPSVIINEGQEVFHASEGISRYLEYRHGEPSRDLLELVYSGLRSTLRNLLSQFKLKGKKLLLTKEVAYKREGEKHMVRLKVQPVQLAGFPEGFIQITFDSAKKNETIDEAVQKVDIKDAPAENEEVVEQLERELEVTKEKLRISTEEYETSNEELKASNEELQSMNEELQLTSEELETSKEELQSINDELEDKVEELRSANNDLQNLMEATEVATIFVDRELKVQRYTSAVTELFNLIPSDKGRPLAHVTHQLNYDHLEEDARRVLDDLQVQKHLVSTTEDSSYIMRLRPYRTAEDKIEGVVFTFVDITELKQATDKLKQQAAQQEAVAKLGLLALDEHNLQLILDKAAKLVAKELKVEFCMLMEFQSDENSLLYKAGKGWPEKEHLKVNLGKNTQFDHTLTSKKPTVVKNYEEEKRFTIPPILNGKPIKGGISVAVQGKNGQIYGILAVFADRERLFKEQEIDFMQVVANLLGEFIKRIRAEANLKQLNAELEQRVEERTKELEETNTKLEERIAERNRLQDNILEISENERWQIGQYLHDELGQPMVAIELLIHSISSEFEGDDDILSELKKVQEMAKEVSTNIRELSHEVTPIDVEEGDIASAFKKVAKSAEHLYGFSCAFKMDSTPELIKSTFVATHMHRIAQEAVKNAGVHGKAKKVIITLSSNKKELILHVKDDGTGYEKKGESDGVGVKLMKYRTELMDGELDVHKLGDDGGTLVSCSVPLERAKKEESFKNNRVKI